MTDAPFGRPRRWRLGTALRLSAFLAGLLAAVLAVTTYETSHTFTDQSISATSRNLAAEVDDFTQSAQRASTTGLQSFAVGYLATQVLPEGELLLIGLPGGVRLGSSGSGALLHDPAVQALLDRPPPATSTGQHVLAGRAWLTMVTPIQAGPRTVGSLLVVADLAQLRADQHRVMVILLGEAAVALVAAVTGAYLLLRRLLRTVGRITTTAGAITLGDLDQRLGDQGTDDEVGQLAATFDVMLDRLAASMKAQRRLLSDVSHQMRTPLTVARGHLEVMDRLGAEDPAEVHETVRTVIDELDHMRGLVERLLMLGRALEPDFLETRPLDLRSFAADLAESARVLAPRHWSLSDVPDLVVDVDADKLRGALLNLLDNAVKATSPADSVAIVVTTGPDRSVVLAVEDSGPGIPVAQRQAAVARFGRPAGTDREGSGLGLAIVNAVAEAHGGRFELGDARLGGCRAAIHLPAGRVSAASPDPLVEV